MQDVVKDMGYRIQGGKPLELKPSAITDTATFDAEVRGEKQSSARYEWIQGALGIALLVAAIILVLWGIAAAAVEGLIALAGGFVLAVIGIAMIATASQSRKQILVARIEGEAYKASAKIVEAAQVTDVVADVRLTTEASIISRAGDVVVDEKIKATDRATLAQDFAKLQEVIERVLPFMGPEGREHLTSAVGTGSSCQNSLEINPDTVCLQAICNKMLTDLLTNSVG